MLDVPGGPVDAASFPKIDFSRQRVVVAAVSGGGDSLGLLFSLRDHLSRNCPGTAILAVTIDHGIRPEAASEANAVAELCARLGVPHRTLRWQEAKPASGLQQAAREARYALLARAAAEAGAGLILTGHTLDDQLETVAMRKRRGEGRGLAGIAPSTLYDGRVWIVRPLLRVRREELRHYLRDRGIAWHEDPSNKDAKFERVRVRSMLAGGDGGPDAHADLIETMDRAATERIRLGEGAAALIRRYTRKISPGLYRMSRDFAALEDRTIPVYALRILLAVIGGRTQLPDESRTSALFGHLFGSGARATLSRCVVETREEGLYLHRELRGLPQALKVGAGEIWDGRYRLEAGIGNEAEIAPFGRDAAAVWAKDSDGPPRLVQGALSAEPAVWNRSECLGGAEAVAAAGPWARFLPSFDLAVAVAATELVGGRPFPIPPFARCETS